MDAVVAAKRTSLRKVPSGLDDCPAGVGLDHAYPPLIEVVLGAIQLRKTKRLVVCGEALLRC